MITGHVSVRYNHCRKTILTRTVIEDLVGPLPVEFDGGKSLEGEVFQLVLRPVHLGDGDGLALLVLLAQLVPYRQNRLAVACNGKRNDSAINILPPSTIAMFQVDRTLEPV